VSPTNKKKNPQGGGTFTDQKETPKGKLLGATPGEKSVKGEADPQKKKINAQGV